jgi:spore maturation protein SpmA
MLNYIWLAFLLIAVLVGGFTGKLPEMTKGAFEMAETAVMKIALPLIGIMAMASRPPNARVSCRCWHARSAH